MTIQKIFAYIFMYFLYTIQSSISKKLNEKFDHQFTFLGYLDMFIKVGKKIGWFSIFCNYQPNLLLQKLTKQNAYWIFKILFCFLAQVLYWPFLTYTKGLESSTLQSNLV